MIPAIAEARKSLLEMQAQHAALRAKLKPGQTILSFNPHVQDPGQITALVEPAFLEFWKIPDEEPFSVFMEGLAIQLDILDLAPSQYKRLPDGYAIARYVLRFETHCKFSSWLALENVGSEDMRLVREHYRRAGMPEEADALTRAEVAWYEAGGHEGNGYDAAGEAYRSEENPNSNEDERWFKLLKVLRADRLWTQ